MSRRLFGAATVAVLLLSVGMASMAVAADPMGSVIAVQGRPLASGTGGSRALQAGSEVFEGDTVTVGDGNAQLELDDGTKLVVGPSSRLRLQAYLRRGNGSASKVSVKALRGTFRFITGNSPKSAYNIGTSNATIGIRGTGFDFTVTDRTLLAVLEGAVRIRGSNGRRVSAAAGCGVAEAGANNVKARELQGEEKSQALRNDLPYITDQGALNTAFYLPIDNCLTFLGSNEGTPGIPPQAPLLIIPALVIPGVIILNDKDNSISPEIPQTVPPTVPDCTLNPTAPECNL